MIVRLRTLLRVSSGSKYMFCYTYTLPRPGVDATHGRRMSTTPDPIPRIAFPFPPAPRTTGRLQRTALRAFHKRRQAKDEHRADCDHHQDLSLIRALKSGPLEQGSCVQALPKLVLHLRTWRTSCRPMGWPAGSVEEELRNIIRQFR